MPACPRAHGHELSCKSVKGTDSFRLEYFSFVSRVYRGRKQRLFRSSRSFWRLSSIKCMNNSMLARSIWEVGEDHYARIFMIGTCIDSRERISKICRFLWWKAVPKRHNSSSSYEAHEEVRFGSALRCLRIWNLLRRVHVRQTRAKTRS